MKDAENPGPALYPCQCHLCASIKFQYESVNCLLWMFQTLFLLGTQSKSSAHCSVLSMPLVRFPHNPQGTGTKFIPVTGGLGKMLQEERRGKQNPSRGNCGFTCPCLSSHVLCNQGRRSHQPVFHFPRPPPAIPSYLAISCVSYLFTASACTCAGTLV